MANYGFYVANTGSTLYSGFTFLDSQGNNVTINIPPSQTFYVSANDIITGSTYTNLDITLIGNLDINYNFSACCSPDSFSIELPNSFSGLSGSSYYVYFGSFTNSTDVAYGCYNITDVSALGNVHTLDLTNCENITDVSALGNIHTLYLTGCNITDVSMLGNVHKLILRCCENITNVSALGNVYYLDLSYCYDILDVSKLGNVNTLNLSGCNITDVNALGNVHLIKN